MPSSLPAFAAVVVAAGSGSRAGGAKQWRALGERPVIRWSVEALLKAGAEDVVVVVPPQAQAEAEAALIGLTGWRLAEGGDERATSVRNGLTALAGPDDRIVLIHDAARPLLSETVIHAVVSAATRWDGALPALPVADSLRRAEDGLMTGAIDRGGLWRAQTPQAFRFGALADAWAAWPADEVATDEATVVQRAGGTVGVVPAMFV